MPAILSFLHSIECWILLLNFYFELLFSVRVPFTEAAGGVTLHGSLLTSSYLGRTEGPEPSFFLFGLHRHCDGEISLMKPFPLSHLTASVMS